MNVDRALLESIVYLGGAIKSRRISSHKIFDEDTTNT